MGRPLAVSATMMVQRCACRGPMENPSASAARKWSRTPLGPCGNEKGTASRAVPFFNHSLPELLVGLGVRRVLVLRHEAIAVAVHGREGRGQAGVAGSFSQADAAVGVGIELHPYIARDHGRMGGRVLLALAGVGGVEDAVLVTADEAVLVGVNRRKARGEAGVGIGLGRS